MSHHDSHDAVQPPSEGNGFAQEPGRTVVPKTTLIQMQPLMRSGMQPSYAQDFEVSHGTCGYLLHGLGIVEGCFGAIPCYFCRPCRNPIHEVGEGSVGLVTRFGQLYKSVDPGLVQVNVRTESIKFVDVKIQIMSIGRLTLVTRDDVKVDIDSDIYFQIIDPYKATIGIADVRKVLLERAQLSLRHVVGAREVKNLLTGRDQEVIAFEVAETVGNVADKWGVAIESVLIKGILFSPEVSAAWSAAHRSTVELLQVNNDGL